MKEHERTHTGEKPFRCSKYDKIFKITGHLKEHERTHTGEEPFNCTKCDKSFSTYSLITNKRYCTSIYTNTLIDKPFMCTKCDKSCSTSSYLKIHERIHSGKKPFVDDRHADVVLATLLSLRDTWVAL